MSGFTFNHLGTLNGNSLISLGTPSKFLLQSLRSGEEGLIVDVDQLDMGSLSAGLSPQAIFFLKGEIPEDLQWIDENGKPLFAYSKGGTLTLPTAPGSDEEPALVQLQGIEDISLVGFFPLTEIFKKSKVRSGDYLVGVFPWDPGLTVVAVGDQSLHLGDRRNSRLKTFYVAPTANTSSRAQFARWRNVLAVHFEGAPEILFFDMPHSQSPFLKLNVPFPQNTRAHYDVHLLSFQEKTGKLLVHIEFVIEGVPLKKSLLWIVDPIKESAIPVELPFQHLLLAQWLGDEELQVFGREVSHDDSRMTFYRANTHGDPEEYLLIRNKIFDLDISPDDIESIAWTVGYPTDKQQIWYIADPAQDRVIALYSDPYHYSLMNELAIPGEIKSIEASSDGRVIGIEWQKNNVTNTLYDEKVSFYRIDPIPSASRQ